MRDLDLLSLRLIELRQVPPSELGNREARWKPVASGLGTRIMGEPLASTMGADQPRGTTL